MWFFSDEAMRIGNFLSGVGSCALAFGAWFQVRAWRKQQIQIKRAEIAGRTLATVIRLFQAIDLITNPTINSPEDAAKADGPHPRSYQQRADFIQRLKVTSKDLQRFFDVKNESEVYLPDEVNQKLDEIWKEWISVKIDIGLHFNYLDKDPAASENQRLYDASFGKAGREKRERLEKEIKDLLRPIASLERAA